MDQLEQAKNMALKYVTMRMRTQQEVKEQLEKKGYVTEIIAQVIDFLQDYHYLDDMDYCRCWIQDRMQFHPCGRQKMAYDLAKKITDRQLVRQSLEIYFSPEQELKLAVTAAQRKLGSSGTAVNREKLSRFLYTKGYGGNIISRVMQADSIVKMLDQRQDNDDNNF